MKTEKLVIPQNLIDINLGLGKWNIIHAYRGSYAHNTRLNPTDKFFIDDIDTMGLEQYFTQLYWLKVLYLLHPN